MKNPLRNLPLVALSAVAVPALLLAACASDDRPDRPSPFERAIEQGDLDYIRSFVSARKSRPGWAADLQAGLDVAAQSCPDNETETSVETFRMLVGAGAGVNAPVIVDEERTTTPLVRAAFYCGPEVVGYLIDAGANVGEAGSDGMTPLMSAADAYYGDIAGKVDVLLAEGASRTTVDPQGRTALDYALENDRVREFPTVLNTLAGEDPVSAPMPVAPDAGS